MELNWRPGMPRKEEKEFFSDFLETLRNNYNVRHQPRLFNFKWRKDPEPEPWLPVYDDMVLSYLTPKEIKKYEDAGETKKNMIDRAKNMIFEQAWNNHKPYEDFQNDSDFLEKKEAFRKNFEKDPVYHTLSIVAHKESFRSEYSGKPEAWEYPDVLAEMAEKKRNIHLMPVQYMMSDSAIGRRSWEILKNNKYFIDFDRTGDTVCSIDTEKKRITLNASASKEACALSLVRSARLLMPDEYSNTSSVEATEARKADAVSAQLAFAEEMRVKNPKILAVFKANGNESLCDAFDKTLNETNDWDAARSAAVDSYLNKVAHDRKPSSKIIARMCKNVYGLSYYIPSGSNSNDTVRTAITVKNKQQGR